MQRDKRGKSLRVHRAPGSLFASLTGELTSVTKYLPLKFKVIDGVTHVDLSSYNLGFKSIAWCVLNAYKPINCNLAEVYEAFVPAWIDGDVNNNDVDNLLWVPTRTHI